MIFLNLHLSYVSRQNFTSVLYVARYILLQKRKKEKEKTAGNVKVTNVRKKKSLDS